MAKFGLRVLTLLIAFWLALFLSFSFGGFSNPFDVLSLASFLISGVSLLLIHIDTKGKDHEISSLSSQLTELERRNAFLQKRNEELHDQIHSLAEEVPKRIEERQQEFDDLVAATVSAKITASQKECAAKLEVMEEKQQAELTALKIEISNFDLQMQKVFGDDYLIRASGAPYNTRIDSSGRPHCRLRGKELFDFTFTDTRFHSLGCSSGQTGIQLNVMDYEKSFVKRGLPACGHCMPRWPNMEWYERYQSYRNLLNYPPLELSPEPEKYEAFPDYGNSPYRTPISATPSFRHSQK